MRRSTPLARKVVLRGEAYADVAEKIESLPKIRNRCEGS